MHINWTEWVQRWRALMDAPPLTRADKSKRGAEDPKWNLGDLLAEIPEPDIDAFAQEVGEDKGNLHRLRDVASKWPPEQRVAASWSAHRDLKDHPERFTCIRPGMSVREAAQAAGKKAIDAKPRHRMTLVERATEVMTLLADKKVNDLVLALYEERKEARRKVRAARAAGDERSAEYKAAWRELHQAQTVKSPDRVFLEVVLKIRDTAEYLRAVVDAALDPVAPFVPEHRKPDLIQAIRALATGAELALAALGDDEDYREDDNGQTGRTAVLLESTNESDSDQ